MHLHVSKSVSKICAEIVTERSIVKTSSSCWKRKNGYIEPAVHSIVTATRLYETHSIQVVKSRSAVSFFVATKLLKMQ